MGLGSSRAKKIYEAAESKILALKAGKAMANEATEWLISLISQPVQSSDLNINDLVSKINSNPSCKNGSMLIYITSSVRNEMNTFGKANLQRQNEIKRG